ncbi:MAG: hypothetical protein PVJ69_03095 [Desulfobacteraceae bacterium]|jgi:hypothetical protein
MRNEQDLPDTVQELSDEDQEHIRTLFHEEVLPKLMKLGARLGMLSCEFAGEQFKNWMIQFKSVGDDFEIVDFEYEEDGTGIDLDL